MRVVLTLLIVVLCTFSAFGQQGDNEKLGRAIEYFQHSKYHEALLLFKTLDVKYELSPRFKAYYGVCCFYDMDYKEAVSAFEKALPRIGMFSPQEQALYFRCAAASNTKVRQYENAIPLYDRLLNICKRNEISGVLYGIGLCYMNIGNVSNAVEYFERAIAYCEPGNETSANVVSIEDIKKQINLCTEKK